MRRNTSEHGAKFRIAERLAAHIGEYLHAACPELIDRAVDLVQRCLDIVHRQRRGESGKAIRVPAANFGKLVIGKTREFGRALGRGDEFERRVGQRQHLLEPVELVQQPQALVDIDDRRQSRKHRDRRLPGNQRGNTVEVFPRDEVVEHIDDHR
jgi:hypothetical protein